MPIFMNSKHELGIPGYCGGLVDVTALLLRISSGEIHKAESGNNPNHTLLPQAQVCHFGGRAVAKARE